MIQPTKDQYRHWLSTARSELKEEKSRHRAAEHQLRVASRVLGELVVQGKIAIPAERLGELALQIAAEKEAEHERVRLLEGFPPDDA